MVAILQGAEIKAADYNGLRSIVSNILGNGGTNPYTTAVDPSYGYGQTLTSTPVTALLDDISPAEWAALKVDIIKAATHQGVDTDVKITSLPTIAQIAAGLDIKASDIDKFNDALSLINTNRFVVTQYSIESFSPDISNSRTTVWGSPTKPLVQHSFTIDFGSANNARYFFNSGGTINFKASRTGGSSTTQNHDWTTLLDSFSSGSNSVIYSYNGASAVSGQTNAIGWYSLTTSPQMVYRKQGGIGGGIYTAYTSNDYRIMLSCNVANNSTGTARYMYVTVYFTDSHTNLGVDQVNGTLTSTIFIKRATGSNVQVVQPTATNTTLLST
jgi:hypothetical protein